MEDQQSITAPQESQTLDLIHFPLHGSRLIEASAGTGKTFTLAHLYARLVLGHGDTDAFQQPLMPPDILVVTFTDAATQELRDRIRAKLVEAADIFALQAESFEQLVEDEPHNPLVHLRQDIAADKYSQCTRQLIQAAEWMDEASISTIHGWCHRMLHEHAFHSGSLFEQELITDQTELLEQVVQDYWRNHFYHLDPAQALLVLQSYSSPGALRGALMPLLKITEGQLHYRGQTPVSNFDLTEKITEVLAAQEHAIQLENQTKTLWLKDQGSIEEALNAIRPNLNGTKHNSTKPEKFTEYLSDITQWARGEIDAPGKLANFAPGRFAFKKGKDCPEPEFTFFTALGQWQEAISDDSDESGIDIQILVHAARWCKNTFNQRQQAKAQMGFDDLLTQLDQALQGPQAEALAASIRQQFPVALIDEFQDTDPVQYRIFDRIYNLEENNSDTGLILIGDPKQAIYAFRGADIYTYLQAKDATQGRHFTLKKNFRSTTGMVQATNALFEHGEQHALAAFRFRSDSDTNGTENPLPFVSVDAQGKDDAFFANGQTCKPMTLWHLAPDEGSERVSATRYRNEMAQTSASEIVRLLNLGQQGLAGFGTVDVQQAVKPGDIAILVRNKLEADAVQSALAERSVNSVYLSDRDSVFATQEAQDLLIWLKACAEPSRDTLLRNALATSTLDLPISQLDELNHDELAWEEQVDLFSQYRRIWWQQGVLAMCHRLLHDFELPGRLLAQTGGERRLTNVLHLAEWLQQSAAVIEGDFALIRYLAEHIGETSDEFILRLESDDDLVKVVTIHKSKGLEYPLVFLPFISSWKEASGDRFSYHSKSHKGRVLEISGKKAEPESWLRADSERLSEDLRLIYVALTRAKYATWLGIAPLVSGNSKKPQLEKGALGYLLAGGATFTSDSLVQCLTDLAETSPHIDLQALPEANLSQYQEQTNLHLTQAEISQVEPRDPWWIASYSALQTGAVVSVEDASLIETNLEESDLSQINSERSGFEATDIKAIDLEAPDTPMQATAEEESDQPDDIRLSPAALQDEQHLRELHLFPRGANAGTFLHGLLEWAAEEGFDQAIHKDDERLDMLQRRCQLRGWQQWVQPLSDWLTDFLSTPWQLEQAFSPVDHKPDTPPAPLRLADLTVYQAEMEFWIEAHQVNTQTLDRLVREQSLAAHPRPEILYNRLNGMLKGFIDLVVQHDGRYYIIDWKSNYIGPENNDYQRDSMLEAILKKRYDMQYILYLLALHRHLKSRLPHYDYDQHIGGALYLFLRGSHSDSQGVFADRPSKTLIEQLDRLFADNKEVA